MNVVFKKPKDKKLGNLIEGFYIISKESFSSQIQYYTFPNNYRILSFFQNAKVQCNENSILVSPSPEIRSNVLFVNKYSKPISVTYSGAVNEITIYFKPIGLNYFLDYSCLQRKDFYENFIPFPDYTEEMNRIFQIKDMDSKLENLEIYLLNKIKAIDLSLMETIVSDIEENLRLDEIAAKIGYSRQYINKLLLRNIGKTSTEYRKIHRFRNALSEFNNNKKLTALAYESDFFDQSHFIKDFKSLTNFKPRQFFKKTNKDNDIVWLFI